MPGLPMPLAGASITSWLAASIAAPRRTSSAVLGACSAMTLTAMELATSPAACPPIPSQMAKRGVRKRNESSLCSRTNPTSERAPQEIKVLEPETASASPRPSSGSSQRPGALTGSCAGVSEICVVSEETMSLLSTSNTHNHIADLDFVCVAKRNRLFDDVTVNHSSVCGTKVFKHQSGSLDGKAGM